MKTVFLCAAVTFLAVAFRPADLPAQSTPINCGALTTQSAMNECLGREAAGVQGLLDTLLKEIGRTLDAGETKRLNDVQKTWAAYREAHCAWQAAFSEGGSIQSELRSACLTEITWDRIKELRLTLCEGQGLTGSCEASRRYDRPER